MRYYFKRYRNGMQRIKQWLPLVLLPLAVYLLAAGASPDRFSVTQKIAVQKTAPIALSRTPVDCLPMAELLSRPAELFLDDFAMMELTKQILKGAVTGPKEATDLRDLKGMIESSLMLKPDSDDAVHVGYYGPDMSQGRFFVTYYAQRLVNRSKEGIVRTMRNQNRNMETGGASQPQNAAGTEMPATLQPAALGGEMQVLEHRSMWRMDRLFPAMVILLVSLMIWCIAAGIAEWMDPSFSTERQVSRYLNIPVVGVVPNMSPLIQRLEAKK
jgi:hypothetical protein